MSSPPATPASAVARAALVAVLATAALVARTAMPIDETRYLAVAWEMWQRGDFLVPYLNGATYSHKPPLLFWLIHAGWAMFGVNDVWPRLLPSLCALATLAVTARIARTLWPREPWLAARAAWILLGSMLFGLFAVMLMFDMLLALCVTVGTLGIVHAARGRARGFALLALGIGAGVLAKGPAVLLHLLPAALLAPLWVRSGTLRWPRWYAGVLAAVLGGAAIALAWAIPAGASGGEAYRNAIFWGQTAHRMVDSFAHERPIWWYLPWLPLVLAPFLVWRPLWEAVRAPRALDDDGLRLALCLMLPALGAFSLVSGKQLHYLVPQVPAFALFAARALERSVEPRRAWLAALSLAALGVAIVVLPHVRLPEAAAALKAAPLYGAVAFVALAAWLAWKPRSAADQVPRLAAAAVLALAAVHAVFVRPFAPAWDVRPLAQQLRSIEAQGRPLAHDGVYHGQFQFAGRLAAPLGEVRSVAEASAWIDAHPRGAVVVYFRDPAALASFAPLASQPFRGRYAALIDAPAARAAVEVSRSQERGGAGDEPVQD